MSILDRNAAALGVSVSTLMECAGKRVADYLALNYPKERYSRVAVLCGGGNNGGDGFVCARHLKDRGYRVRVISLVPPEKIRTEVAKANFKRVLDLVDFLRPEALDEQLEGFDLYIDAMLGVGIKGRPRAPYDSVIEALRHRRVVSVDVPSGMGTELSVLPEVVVTFHAVKEGMETLRCHIVVVDIGIPERAWTHTGPGDLVLLKRPEKDAHKGDGGRVIVVGGGPYTGAPALAALAALRAGADLAYVICPMEVVGIVASYTPQLIVRGVPGGFSKNNLPIIKNLIRSRTSVVIGPGMGQGEGAKELVKAVVGLNLPTVLDADALHLLDPREAHSRCVLTPHRGEMRALAGIPEKGDLDPEKLERSAEELARLGPTVVLKGPTDVIASPERTSYNETGNPGMTCGGSGDVLAGVLGALLAQGLRPHDAGRLGTYMVGCAGDRVWAEKRTGMTSTDIIEALPSIIKDGFELP